MIKQMKCRRAFSITFFQVSRWVGNVNKRKRFALNYEEIKKNEYFQKFNLKSITEKE